jgi:hypothetical protein
MKLVLGLNLLPSNALYRRLRLNLEHLLLPYEPVKRVNICYWVLHPVYERCSYSIVIHIHFEEVLGRESTLTLVLGCVTDLWRDLM